MEQLERPATEKHAPLVSVVLLAYNHLEYTRLCVEGLFRHTADVNYELITIDNGSSDGTREYFEGLPNRKKLSFPENVGVDTAVNRGFALAEGKYILNLSNDIVPTARWLKNLVACMESDERIAMVAPVCNFSSNNQQISLPYDSLEQMQQAAEAYNVSNPLMWEERLKLVTYTCLFRADVFRAVGCFDEEFNPGGYDDDAISFTVRRSGYKLKLAADTYVHHFGSVTFNAEYLKADIATRNFWLFQKKFGVNSWAACMIDFNVVNLVDYGKKKCAGILGIGSSCGSSLLQVKNMFRKAGVTDVSLDYCAEDAGYLADLATICRIIVWAPAEKAARAFAGRAYDLIVVESETDMLTDVGTIFYELSQLLAPGGQLITTATEATLPVIAGALARGGLSVSNQMAGRYFSFTRLPG